MISKLLSRQNSLVWVLTNGFHAPDLIVAFGGLATWFKPGSLNVRPAVGWRQP